MEALEQTSCTDVVQDMESHVRRRPVRPEPRTNWRLRSEGIEHIAYQLMCERPIAGWDARRQAAELWDQSPVLR